MEKISHDDFYLVIGKLAVKLKFICEEQLQEALLILNARKRAGQQLFLGEIMVLIEMLSQSQLDFLLSAQKIIETREWDRRFGLIALKNDFVTPEDLDRALKAQKKFFAKTESVKLIGDLMIELEIIEPRHREAILTRQKCIAKSTAD